MASCQPSWPGAASAFSPLAWLKIASTAMTCAFQRAQGIAGLPWLIQRTGWR
ncbi:MAG TPA: hypothetical protein VJ851_00500 [Jatrophihabitans sp.]|nr:hypothetical protein [Jatrophihabitans sp.]